ncbi:MAG: hypothetical protein IPK60_21520 [Sandaracinaceae bacterium]|nr:hypothetical protein [Sandaracinaceae bacterium]
MTTPPTVMKYAVTARVSAGGEASAQARTSSIAFDGTSHAGETLPGPAES